MTGADLKSTVKAIRGLYVTKLYGTGTNNPVFHSITFVDSFLTYFNEY